MEKARSHDERKVQRHIEEAQKALAVEDFGEAFKWILKLQEPVRTLNFLVGENFQIYEVPLYKEAAKIDKRYGTNYCSELGGIGREMRRLAESYTQREEAGLVLVLHPSIEPCDRAKTLKNAGFDTMAMGYNNLLLESVGLNLPTIVG